MAPILSFLISSVSKKKEPRCVCLSEAKASHSHKVWTEVSSSVPHSLQVGLLLSPITYKCLLKVLCPVRRPITTLDCVLFKDNNRALVARLGPEIYSRACLCVLQEPRHYNKCWFSFQRFVFLLMFCLETPRKGSGPTKLRTEPSLASLSTISFPRRLRNIALDTISIYETPCNTAVNLNATLWWIFVATQLLFMVSTSKKIYHFSITNSMIWGMLLILNSNESAIYFCRNIR